MRWNIHLRELNFHSLSLFFFYYFVYVVMFNFMHALEDWINKWGKINGWRRGGYTNWYLYDVMYQLLGDRSNGSPFGNRKSGKSSVFSLFNLKEKSRFWSESVIRPGMFFTGSYSIFVLCIFSAWLRSWTVLL